jgi:5'(3')-deoxyribonucleotidase
MSKGTIAIDVDLTVVRSDLAWWKWLQRLTDCYMPFPEGDNIDYDLSKHFREELNELGIDGKEFWRYEGIYDWMSPMDDSVNVIDNLNLAGWEIVFVSAIKGHHHKSKYNFLKKNFPCMAGFIATKEKQLVYCDVMIDDRNENLGYSRAGGNIKFLTPYNQTVTIPDREIFYAGNWKRVEEIIKCQM